MESNHRCLSLATWQAPVLSVSFLPRLPVRHQRTHDPLLCVFPLSSTVRRLRLYLGKSANRQKGSLDIFKERLGANTRHPLLHKV